MALKTKREKDPSRRSKDAVDVLSGLQTFNDAQGKQVLDALNKVHDYLFDKKFLGEPEKFGKNHEVLQDLLEKVGVHAGNTVTDDNAQVNSEIANLAKQCADEIARIRSSEKESDVAFGKTVPSKLGETTPIHSAHKTPTLPVISVTGIAKPHTTVEESLELETVLPSSIEFLYSPGEEQNTLLQDIEDLHRARLQNDQQGMQDAAKKFWNDLIKYGNEEKAAAAVCGTGAGSPECSNLIEQLQNGNYDALFDGSYPLAEAFLETSLQSWESSRKVRDIIATAEAKAKASLLVSENGEIYFKGRLVGVITEEYTETTEYTQETGETPPSTETKREGFFSGDVRVGGELSLPRDRAAIRAETGVSVSQPWWAPGAKGVVLGIPAEVGLTLKTGPSEGLGLLMDVSVGANFAQFPIAGATEKFIEAKEEADLTLSLFQLELEPDENGVSNYMQFVVYGSIAGLQLKADSFEQTLHNVPVMGGIGLVWDITREGERQLADFSNPGDTVKTNGQVFLGAAGTYDLITERPGAQLNLQLGTEAVAGELTVGARWPGPEGQAIPGRPAALPEFNFTLGVTGTFDLTGGE